MVNGKEQRGFSAVVAATQRECSWAEWKAVRVKTAAFGWDAPMECFFAIS